MNACRRIGSFGNAQSTVVKDFSAFQGLPPPVLGMRRVVARTCPIFRQMPLDWERENAYIRQTSSAWR